MATVTTNLGVVTAYGDAVAAGYTGTKAQWQALMASYATVAQEAQGYAANASTSATNAAASERNASSSATTANNAKTAAQTAQGYAEAAQTAAEDARDDVQASATQIAQNTTDISNLNNHFGNISEHYRYNLFDSSQLLKANSWTESDGEYSGTIGNLFNQYKTSTDGLQILGGFKENTQYSIRLKYYTSDSPVSTGNTIQFRVYYTDSTDSGVIYLDIKTSYTSRTAVTASGKTVSKIVFQYSNSDSATNTIHIKEMQIAEGASQPDYVPYETTAIDLISRASDTALSANLWGTLRNTEKVMDVKYKKGDVNSNGNISTGSGVTTIIPSTVTRMSLSDGISMVAMCFDDDGYLGKINANDALDQVSGNWKTFTGDVNIAELFIKYSATYIAYKLSDGSTTISNDAQAVTFGKANCVVYTQDYADYDFVPPYFTDSISTAVSSAKSDMGACGKDGFSFIFTTDNHWNHNDGHSPAIIKDIQAKTKIQDVILGGDMIDGGPDKDHELNLLQSVIRKFDSDAYRLHYVFGNHDSNTVGQTSEPALHFSNNEVYMATQKPQEYTSEYSDDGFTDYYWDDVTTKTRVIVVDSKVEGIALWESQLIWFNATLASTPSGYRIIVVMHIWYGASSIADQGQAISDAVDAWNAENDTKVIALFGGHTHADADYVTAGGVPLIITANDGSSGSVYETVNSQVIDIITVNYTDKKINCRRVGRGSDREITWS